MTARLPAFGPLFALLAAMAAVPSRAETPDLDVRALGLSPEFLQMAGAKGAGFVDFLMSQVGPMVRNGVITKADVDLRMAVDGARRRTERMAPYLMFDLDLDGVISREEIDRVSPVLRDNERRFSEVILKSGDADGDGSLSLTEIYKAVAVAAGDEVRVRNPFLDDVLKSDLDSDGRVTVEEIITVVRAVKASAPARSDTASGAGGNARPSMDCAPPMPDGAAEVVVVSAYGGAALSNIAVAGQDRASTAVRLVVEPGTAPLYIFAASLTPVTWHVEGNAARVQRIVVQPPLVEEGAGAGVSGLGRDQVSFVPPEACIEPFYRSEGDVEDISWKWSVAALEKVLGRKVQHVVSAYEIPNASVPSGGMTVTEPEYAPPTKNADGTISITVDMNSAAIMMKRSHPNGLIEADPMDVAAPEPVEVYEVLPQEAGLAQLLEEGVLERVTLQSARRQGSAFLIRKPMKRFPPGLGGGRGVSFVLGTGVPMPGGDSGRFPVFSEATGECLTRDQSLCR
jgi:EF hand